MGVLYGANASGKTNFLNILDFVREIVLHVPSEKLKGINVQPFLLDEACKAENSEFSISFYIDGTRFIYELSLNSNFIFSEKLIYYPNSQPALVFERAFNNKKVVSKVKFGSTLDLIEKDKIILEGDLIVNTTLLSVYLKKNVNIDVLEKVVKWFSYNLSGKVDAKSELKKQITEKIYNSADQKKLTLELLQKADFNIVDIEVEKHQSIMKIDKEGKSIYFPDLFLENFGLDLYDLKFIHKSKKGTSALPYEAQSEGTKRYFELSGILSTLLTENNIVYIDELESSLHPDLTDHFIKTFLANSKNSQLLFTTHNLILLDSDYIRRDVVWFCEKNENGATELYSAYDFGLHKNISLFNAYKTGKLGAKPHLGSIFLENYGKEK
jgi:hypothetical protein